MLEVVIYVTLVVIIQLHRMLQKVPLNSMGHPNVLSSDILDNDRWK